MRPLRKGAARTGLAKGLNDIAHKIQYGKLEDAVADGSLTKVTNTQAAVLGGAIEEALREMFPVATMTHGADADCPEVRLGKWKHCRGHKQDEGQAELATTFWRLANENLWRLTRALDASNLLEKAGE